MKKDMSPRRLILHSHPRKASHQAVVQRTCERPLGTLGTWKTTATFLEKERILKCTGTTGSQDIFVRRNKFCAGACAYKTFMCASLSLAGRLRGNRSGLPHASTWGQILMLSRLQEEDSKHASQYPAVGSGFPICDSRPSELMRSVSVKSRDERMLCYFTGSSMHCIQPFPPREKAWLSFSLPDHELLITGITIFLKLSDLFWQMSSCQESFFRICLDFRGVKRIPFSTDIFGFSGKLMCHKNLGLWRAKGSLENSSQLNGFL